MRAVAVLLAFQACAAQYVPPEESVALLDPAATYPGECPCVDKSLCEIITRDRFADGKELFAFHVAGTFGNFDQWRRYDWSRLTTLAMWEFMDEGAELYCYAKSLGARVVLPASPPADVYTGNVSAKEAWTEAVVDDARKYFYDGVNMDTEDAIDPRDRSARDGLTEMVARVRAALPAGAVVGFDVGWTPSIDGRFYDYAGIAEQADYLLIMACVLACSRARTNALSAAARYDRARRYDMASYIFGACVATPNSPPPQVEQGILQYLALVEPRKLVLALPWYGRQYACEPGTGAADRYCAIAPAPWRDCNCTDANAPAVDFGHVAALAETSATGAMSDEILEQRWMNHVDAASGNVTQLWYDDLRSLSAKYSLVASFGLLGVGVWTANMLDYGPSPFNNSELVPQATHDMWTAISTAPFAR